MNPDLSKKGTLSSLWKAHSNVVKYLSLGGLLLTCCFLPTAAVHAAQAVGAAPGLLDIGGQFYSTAFNNAAQNFIPGWVIILNEMLRLTTDVILPSISALVSGIASPALDS